MGVFVLPVLRFADSRVVSALAALVLAGLLATPVCGAPASSSSGANPDTANKGHEGAQAESAPGTEGEDESQGKGSEVAWYWRTMDATHEVLSRRIESTAKNIDSFFVTQEALEEATSSYIKLRSDGLWAEGEGLNLDGTVDARLDLPATQEKLQLVVEQGPSRAEEDSEDLTAPSSGPEDEEEEDTDLSLAIEGWLEGKDGGNWQIRPALGALARINPEAFARVRAIRRESFEAWDSRFSATLAYFYTKGATLEVSQNFDRPFSENFLFRSRTGYGWTRRKELERLSHSFTVFHELAERNKLAYEVGAYASNEVQWASRSYFSRIRFRRRIYRHWLFAELAPQVRWSRANRFHRSFSLRLQLEAVFGIKSLRKSRKTRED